MTENLAALIESGEFRPLTSQEFLQRYRAQEDRLAEAAADALYPVLATRPALLRSVLRDDTALRPMMLEGWNSPDEEIVVAMPMPNGAWAALVRDATRTEPDPERLATALAAKMLQAQALERPQQTTESQLSEIINIPEAARLVGMSEDAFRKHLERHSVAGMIRRGRRIQFHRARFLAGFERKATRR